MITEIGCWMLILEETCSTYSILSAQQDQETPQEGSRALILQLVVAPHAGAGPLVGEL